MWQWSTCLPVDVVDHLRSRLTTIIRLLQTDYYILEHDRLHTSNTKDVAVEHLLARVVVGLEEHVHCVVGEQQHVVPIALPEVLVVKARGIEARDGQLVSQRHGESVASLHLNLCGSEHARVQS